MRKKARDADKKRRDAFAKKTRDAKNAAATKKKAPASAGPGPGPAAKASARVVSSRRR